MSARFALSCQRRLQLGPDLLKRGVLTLQIPQLLPELCDLPPVGLDLL